MNVNTNASNQQAYTRGMYESLAAKSNGIGKVANDTIAKLPEDKQADVQSLLKNLEQSEKRNVIKQIAQINSSDMTQEDLSSAISDIFATSQQAALKPSSQSSSFSVYA